MDFVTLEEKFFVLYGWTLFTFLGESLLTKLCLIWKKKWKNEKEREEERENKRERDGHRFFLASKKILSPLLNFLSKYTIEKNIFLILFFFSLIFSSNQTELITPEFSKPHGLHELLPGRSIFINAILWVYFNGLCVFLLFPTVLSGNLHAPPELPSASPYFSWLIVNSPSTIKITSFLTGFTNLQQSLLIAWT